MRSNHISTEEECAIWKSTLVNYYNTCDPDVWTQKVLFPHSPQQLAEAKEGCKIVLPQIFTEYTKKIQVKAIVMIPMMMKMMI